MGGSGWTKHVPNYQFCILPSKCSAQVFTSVSTRFLRKLTVALFKVRSVSNSLSICVAADPKLHVATGRTKFF